MIVKHKKNKVIVSGPKGEICITDDDKIAYRFIMLIEEACESKSALEIAKKYGFSLSRFKQIKKITRRAARKNYHSSCIDNLVYNPK